MTERIRTTISLAPEALEVFKRMAAAGNMSVSRCMGEWLSDTADAAEMITLKMEEAKKAPMKVMREMRAMVAGLGASVIEAEEEVRQLRLDSDRRAPRDAGAEPIPPSSNTGVLVPPSPSKAKQSKRPVKNWKVL
jgi:hypothetical protein